jgi:crotonobetainyl-CoA:carnitine CoA-transferase CaiB-like acyl-CoA transferase
MQGIHAALYERQRTGKGRVLACPASPVPVAEGVRTGEH